MHARLKYRSGQQYSESFYEFDVQVRRDGTRVKSSFTEKSDSRYASFSLQHAKAAQLAHAINVQALSDGAEPITFSVTEEGTRMNVRLRYATHEKKYWEQMSDFEVKVVRHGTRVKVSLKERSDFRYFSFSLPLAKAMQFAHALGMHSVSDCADAVTFSVMEASIKIAA